jgi:hypothetical protein
MVNECTGSKGWFDSGVSLLMEATPINAENDVGVR